jgi:NAD+ synthase (glutamine-hydrolysing)
MKIAIAQLNYTIGNFDENKAKIASSIRRAKADEARIVLFCEQAISGKPAYDLLNNVVFLEKCRETLKEVAAECDGITAIIGLPLLTDQGTISAAAIVADKKVTKYIGKQNVSSREELHHLDNSKGYGFVEVDGKKVAVFIGSDIRYFSEEFGNQADLIVSLQSSPYARGVVQNRYDFFSKLAFRTASHVVYLNHVGGHTDLVYDGSSAFFNRQGEAIAFLQKFEEDYVIVDTCADNPVLGIPEQNKTANVYRAIKLGLHDYFTKNGFKKACLGLSGGIDSAVVAALAAETLGPENVKVLLLPSAFSSDHSVEDAVVLAERLGVEYSIVPISDTYDVMLKSLQSAYGRLPFDVTEENIQSRLRAVLLMAFSNKFGHILLNTANKSESAVGYGTLYGDTVGAISILGDLYKTEVFDLARYLNREREIIPQHTMTKAPSAELRPEQKDTDSLPPYDVLDAILYRLIEENQTVDEIITAGFDNGTVKRVYELLIRNEYKRYQFCPVLRLSTCTLGKDRILPLTYKFESLL